MEIKAEKNKTNNGVFSIDKIKEPNLRDIFLILTSSKILNPSRINLTGDIENNIKQEIKDSIHDKLQEMNEIFSELRKSGKDLGVLNFKLMILPLKIKIFLATYEKKDLENLLIKIQEIDREITLLKK